MTVVWRIVGVVLAVYAASLFVAGAWLHGVWVAVAAVAAVLNSTALPDRWGQSLRDRLYGPRR